MSSHTNETVVLANLCALSRPPLEKIKLLIDQGVNLNTANKYSDDPMYRATAWVPRRPTQLRLVKLLVEGGADIHKNNSKAFRNAVEAGDTEVVEYLIEQGVNFHINGDEAIEHLLGVSKTLDSHSNKTRIELLEILLRACIKERREALRTD